MDSLFQPKTAISIVAALQIPGDGIGCRGKLLYRLPGDMKRFQQLTWGHPVIMGRRTLKSIGHPLIHRRNIIVSRMLKRVPGAEVARSLDEALRMARRSATDEIFVIGGAEIYRLALPLADRLYLTLIPGKKRADAFFPEGWPEQFPRIISRVKKIGAISGLKYEFLDLAR